MKIFIKSLKGDKTEFEIALEDTVESLKQKIKEVQGHAIDLQKLIAFGKIMEDAKTLGEYNLKENDNIVLMVAKPKPPARPQSEAPQSVQQAPAQVPSGTGVLPGPSKFGAPAAAGPSPVSPPQPPLQGPEYEANVQRIMELGMPRGEVEAALRAARGHPDLAMEFLLNGIPPSLLAGGQGHAHRQAPVGNPSSAVPSDNHFAFLRTNPAMLQIRSSVQQNPALLPSLIQQIQTTNPQLARLIAQYPQEFQQFMMETGPQVDPNLVAALPRPGNAPQTQAVQPPVGQMQAARSGGGGHHIQLSQEENAAVANLASLGFSRHDALEAYLSCDKNEDLAANLLFETYTPLAAQSSSSASSPPASQPIPIPQAIPPADPSPAVLPDPPKPESAVPEAIVPVQVEVKPQEEGQKEAEEKPTTEEKTGEEQDPSAGGSSSS